jgi:hypothetical protein
MEFTGRKQGGREDRENRSRGRAKRTRREQKWTEGVGERREVHRGKRKAEEREI